MMISIGLVALVLSTIEHRRSMQAMRVEFGSIPYSTSAIVATLVAVLGVVALVAVALRA